MSFIPGSYSICVCPAKIAIREMVNTGRQPLLMIVTGLPRRSTDPGRAVAEQLKTRAATTGTACTPLGNNVQLDLVSRSRQAVFGRDPGAISSTRATSWSKVGASVVSGSSSFKHHHTPASLSHSALIS
jgi:hypothetical protein